MSLTDSYKQRLKQLNSSPSAQRSSSSGKSTGARSAKSSLTDSYKQRLAQLAASGQIKGPKPATFSELRQSSAKMLQQQSSVLQAARKEREKAQNTIYKGEQSGRYNFDGDRGGTAKGTGFNALLSDSAKVGKAVAGGVKSYLGVETDTFRSLYESGQEARTSRNKEMQEEYKYSLDRAKRDLAAMEEDNRLNPGTWTERDLKSQQNIVDDWQRKYDAMSKVTGDRLQEKATQATAQLADQASYSAERDIAASKAGKGALWGLGMDAVAAGTQMLLDGATGQALGVGESKAFKQGMGLAAMGFRSFGSGTQQARLNGAKLANQLGFGAATAAVELISEKIFDGLAGIYGAGAADEVVEKVIRKMAKSNNGRRVLHVLASGVEEGLEEVISGIVSPALESIYDGKNPLSHYGPDTLSDLLHDAMVGGILGGVGGTLSVATGKYNPGEGTVEQPGNPVSKVNPTTENVKDQETVQKAVNKAQTARYDKNVETAEATVLNRGATLYAQLGMNVKKAEAKASVVQKLIDGKDVTTGELKSLNLSDAKYQAIFTELTGVAFPEGVKMSDDQRFNLARTAKDVAAARAEAEKIVSAVLEPTGETSGASATVDTTQPENAPQGVQEAAETAELRDPDNGPADAGRTLPTYEEFSKWYRSRADGEVSEEQVRQEYDNFTAYENETLDDGTGVYTRSQFRDAMRKTEQGAGMSDEAIDAYFDFYRSQVNKSVGQSASPARQSVPTQATGGITDLRGTLSEDTQKILSTVERKLGVRIEVVPDIYAEKAGKFAEGEHSGNRIRLALNARGQLTRDEAILQLLRHELTHHLQTTAPKAYRQFVDYVISNMPDYQARFDERARTYQGVISADQKSRIDDEVAAQYAEKLFTDEEFIEALARQDRTLAEKILDAIKSLVSRLTGEELSDLQKTAVKAQGLWEKALASAAKGNAEKVGIVYDERTESYAPTSYSLDTWNESDYVTARADAAKEMAAALGITQKKAKAYIDSVNSIAKMIANDRARLDYEASPGRSSFVSNSEYGGSIDFSTICKKRRLFTGTFEAIQRALPNTALTAEEFLEIRSMMDEKGYEVSCGLCYVEGSRANMGQYAKQFLEDYEKTEPEYLPNMAEINTPDGLEGIRAEHPEVYAAYEKFMNGLAQRKPKLYQSATAYRGEVLNRFGKRGSKVTEKNQNGGLRLQSFSDFEIIHLIDCMQVIMDMSRVGLAGQAYTKVPDFAWALGDTGLKINLSLISKGVDSEGRIVLDEKEGMSAEDAFALRDRYSENVGTVLVVFSDEQLRAAMADERIDYVLPFHRSQWRKDQYESMGLPADAKDYTPWQNESYIKPVLKNGKKQRPDNFMPNTYWDFSKTGKENAETYLNMCAEGNRKPKFSHLLVDNKDGSYALQPDGSTDGYWKLLIDFKMYDNSGKGTPQRPVRPDFNMEQASRMLEEYKGGHSRFPAANDVVTEFVEQYKRNHPDAQYSFAEASSEDSDVQYSLVEDEETLDFLNNQEWFKVYRAMYKDGTGLYPPMGAVQGGKRVEPIQYNTWYQADERPELIEFEVPAEFVKGEMTAKGEPRKNARPLTAAEIEANRDVLYGDGKPDSVITLSSGATLKFSDLKPKFVLKKADGGSKVPAAYNPYFHTSLSALNDQFSTAYKRPGLVVVEGYIPKSELTSGYRAAYAKDPVGETEWNSGPVANGLKGDKARKVFLSRWFRASRVVPDAEAARMISDVLEGEDLKVPWNVVTPSLRAALEETGVDIDYDAVYAGTSFEDAQAEGSQYSFAEEETDSDGNKLSPGQAEYFKDSKVRDENGKLIPVYHGTQRAGFTEFSETDDYGYFFTSSLTLANTYSGGGEEFAPRRVDTWDDAIAAARDLGFVLERDSDGSYVLSNDWHRSIWNEDELRDIEAELYEADSVGRGVYATYLNLKDPLIIEGGGANWDSITGSEFQDSIEAVAQDGELELVIRDRVTGEERLRSNFTDFEDVRDALVDLYGGEEDAITDIMDRLQAEIDEEMQYGNYDDDTIDIDYGGYWGYGRSTRDWVREAMEMGYDGVIFKNIVDAGKYSYGSESGDVYVALNANQIKSVNNLNPTEDPDLRYSFADEFEGTNPDLAYLPWADQVDLALTGKLNDILRSDGYTEQGTRLNSVLYVAKEPTALLQETGLSDLPLILTQQHLRNIVGKRWGANGKVINAHNHELPGGLVKKIPEYIRHPVAVFKSEGAQAGGLVLLTPELDAHGDPVCVFIKPDQPSFTYDGVNGPAHFVNVYGLENFNQFLQNAINNDGVLYVDGKKMGQHPAVRDTLNKGASSGEGLTSAYDTIVRSKAPTVKPGERKFSLADDLTPELREEFVKSFDAQFGEGAAEAMFKTHDQMVRAARRAKVKAKTTEESAAAERALAQRRRENAMLAWEIHHKKTLREQQRKYNDALAKERKSKAEAIADTKLVEQAKADLRVQATEMNLGKKAAEKERLLKEKMAEQKAEAAERLRVTKDAYKAKEANNSKLRRTAAKRLLSDKNAVARRKAEIQTSQGPVDTIRKNPRERTYTEKLKAAADELRTRGRAAYRAFVNQAQAIDDFAKRQRGGVYASTLVNIVGGSGSTVDTIFKKGLVDRSGNRIGASLKEVLLCMDASGKKVDEARQALLQDYILHLHNIDRMSFVANARARLDAFETKHVWLANMDGKELAKLVAMTPEEVQKSGTVTEKDSLQAKEYASLLNAYREAEDKPVFADVNGNPVTADTSREIVAKYEAENPWLVDKADGIFKWWDQFMRTWAVGDSLSLEEYETMHQTYPHYAPTYRVDKQGPGGAVSVNGRTASVSKATKAAKGSTLEIVPIEDSYANIASKIVRLARTNELYMNIIDTAMLDDEGLFSDMAAFDWDWQEGAYGQALQLQAILNGATAAEIDNASKVGLEKDGANYRLTGWKDGRKYSAFLSEELYQSIADVTGATDGRLKTLTKLGSTLTGPMKTAITGVNPFFAIRNLSRDIPTAIINSTGVAFPKYWAQAAAEMARNSDNWQTFVALGGAESGYYNNENGFAAAMSKGPGIVGTAVEKLGTINNVTEAATRFAEYLSTIDRMGDTYEARLQGIKNAAEVTVDFSRKGSYGKFINAWVPYWNPAVQGIDKMIRSVVESPNGAPVWKQATKTLGRAAMCTVMLEAVLYGVLKALDRDDDWEKLSDRDKATYYCIPLPDEHKFLKIAKNREWSAILGTPFMMILEGLDGRQNPFENYVETSLEPNFLPGAILRPREGGGYTSDIIGVSQALDLAYNEDFAGRTIVPYAQQQGSLTEQYDSETSVFSRALGELLNFSPMQIDYIVEDYFGDFGDVFTSLTAPATWSSDKTPKDFVDSAWDTFSGPFFADNRYSNQTVSAYYDTLDELGRVVNDKKNQMGSEAYKGTKEYKTQKGMEELYGKQITDLNKQVRGLPDGPDKDALKEQIAGLAGKALEFYKESMSGAITEPQLTAAYADLPSSVSNELIRLNSFAEDYAFEPSDYKPSKYTDPKDKKREYVLDGEAKDRYRAIYDETYAEVMAEEIGKFDYQKANDQKKAEMLEEARDSVTQLAKERFLDWLAKNRRSTEKTK